MYRDEKGNLKDGLLDREAFKQAEKFVVYRTGRNQEKKLDNKKSVSSSQLRKFFSEFRQLEKRVKSEGFERVKPLIKMVKARASYAANPHNPKIPKSFKDFLVANVDMINEKRDFEDFMLYFEAVVGFFYGFEGVKSE